MWRLLLLLTACEQSGPVESAGEVPSGSVTASGAKGSTTAATIDPDAGVPSMVDATIATTPDARRPDRISGDQEARALADRLVHEGAVVHSDGDMGSRRPGTDLRPMIDDVKSDSKNTPSGRVTISQRVTFDETTLTPDVVVAKITSVYMAGIKRCYKSYLASDASARGKVVVTLEINEAGRSISPKVAGFASEIDQCLTGMAGNWVFPIPKDADGEKTEAGFQITFQMIPE